MTECKYCSKALGVFSNWGTKDNPMCFDHSMMERDRQGKTLD